MAVCPTCGHGNAEGAKFCSECGTNLGAPVATSREVRKTVTVVFCDVTGSTALGERLDPESMRKVMSRYFAEMQRVLEDHGGTVEKFIGDAAMMSCSGSRSCTRTTRSAPFAPRSRCARRLPR